jgi:hypothetical protein
MIHFITRRRFIKGMGMLPVLCMCPNILNPLAHLPSMISPPASQASRFWFVGVGEFGEKIRDNLPWGSPYPFTLDPCKIDFDANHDGTVFIVGSASDDDFWKMRDLVLSKRLDYMICICPPQKEFTVNGRLAFDHERFIVAHGDPAPTAVNIIYDLCAMASCMGLCGSDVFTALPEVMGSGISMESVHGHDSGELKKFIFRHLKIIKQHEQVIAIFSGKFDMDTIDTYGVSGLGTVNSSMEIYDAVYLPLASEFSEDEIREVFRVNGKKWEDCLRLNLN